jgi:hypothetical protein
MDERTTQAGPRALALAALLALGAGAADAQVTRDNFLLRTAGDFVALCGVAKDDPNATAAIHFCHGYWVGMDQLAEVTGRPFRNTLYCPPEGIKLTRGEAIGLAVAWLQKNPSATPESAPAGIVRWAAATWPCKK